MGPDEELRRSMGFHSHLSAVCKPPSTILGKKTALCINQHFTYGLVWEEINRGISDPSAKPPLTGGKTHVTNGTIDASRRLSTCTTSRPAKAE